MKDKQFRFGKKKPPWLNQGNLKLLPMLVKWYRLYDMCGFLYGSNRGFVPNFSLLILSLVLLVYQVVPWARSITICWSIMQPCGQEACDWFSLVYYDANHSRLETSCALNLEPTTNYWCNVIKSLGGNWKEEEDVRSHCLGLSLRRYSLYYYFSKKIVWNVEYRIDFLLTK